MGSSNARMAMLLVERLTERKSGGCHRALDPKSADVLASVERIARDAAMRFKAMNAFDEVKPDKMLELYGQALNACVWHTNPQKHLEHPELLSKYGAVTDLRTIVEDNLVAANGSETEGRCFTMAPAMMAFFRIMLSYDCLVPIDVTGVSFEHAMLHFVTAALRSCAGRSVRDFLSLIVSDPSTIPTDDPQRKYEDPNRNPRDPVGAVAGPPQVRREMLEGGSDPERNEEGPRDEGGVGFGVHGKEDDDEKGPHADCQMAHCAAPWRQSVRGGHHPCDCAGGRWCATCGSPTPPPPPTKH
jgi:hypothetical protein